MKRVKQCPSCNFLNDTFLSRCEKCNTSISNIKTIKVEDDLEYGVPEEKPIEKAVVIEKKECPFCGASNDTKAVICVDCGKPIINIEKKVDKEYILYDKNYSLSLLEGKEIILGRKDFIDDDDAKFISREHVKIIAKTNGLVFIDLNSTNGTKVDNVELVADKEQEFSSPKKILLANKQVLIKIK